MKQYNSRKFCVLQPYSSDVPQDGFNFKMWYNTFPWQNEQKKFNNNWGFLQYGNFSPTCLIAFPLLPALESDYIQWHKFNVSGTAAANKATLISSCPIGSGICAIYKGRSGKGRLLADGEKLLSEEKALVSSSLPHCATSTFSFSGLSLIPRSAMPCLVSVMPPGMEKPFLEFTFEKILLYCLIPNSILWA